MNAIFSINKISKTHYLSTKTTIPSIYTDLLYKLSNSVKGHIIIPFILILITHLHQNFMCNLISRVIFLHALNLTENLNQRTPSKNIEGVRLVLVELRN